MPNEVGKATAELRGALERSMLKLSEASADDRHVIPSELTNTANDGTLTSVVYTTMMGLRYVQLYNKAHLGARGIEVVFQITFVNHSSNLTLLLARSKYGKDPPSLTGTVRHAGSHRP